MRGLLRVTLAIFASFLTIASSPKSLAAEDLDSLELPEITIPNSPPQSNADACRAMAQFTYNACIARGENPFTCTEEYRKTVAVTCHCLEDANKATPLCQPSGIGTCLQELTRCQIEEDVRFSKCLQDGNSFQVCSSVRSRNLGVCNADFQACFLLIPPLYLASVSDATIDATS